MNNDIKEILNNPKILMLSYGNYISLDDYVKLKDCITNLQEENKQLKEDKKKAIEYIGNGNIGIPRKTRDKFISILKGVEKE